MSHRLSELQREIERILQQASDAGLGMLTFADIRAAFIVSAGGDPKTDYMNPNRESSLKRSLNRLIDRGEVVRVGEGGVPDLFRYATVEAFVDEPNTNDAKRLFAELGEVSSAALARLSSRRP